MHRGRHTHTLTIPSAPGTESFDLKNFTFTVAANSQDQAVQQISEAINALRSANIRVKESGVMLNGVRVSYFYPNRPHCGMIGPYWDE